MTIVLSCLGLLASLSAHSQNSSERPNIVFFLSDDQPLRAMSHVDPYFHTPNMDRLASEGVVLRMALSRAPSVA